MFACAAAHEPPAADVADASPNSRRCLTKLNTFGASRRATERLTDAPRLPQPAVNLPAERLARDERRGAARPWHSRCDTAAAMSRQAPRYLINHAALPQLRTADGRCSTSGEDSHVDATELREVVRAP